MEHPVHTQYVLSDINYFDTLNRLLTIRMQSNAQKKIFCNGYHLLDVSDGSNRTPFYQTSNVLEHHFLNIEQTQTYSNWNTLFLASNKRTSNLIGPITFFTNDSLNILEHNFIITLSRLKRVHLLVIEPTDVEHQPYMFKTHHYFMLELSV